MELLGYKNILFLFPHPDDESYSCSSLIRMLNESHTNCHVLYLSSGTPTKIDFVPPMANRYKFDNYSRTRKKEWLNAMSYLGLKKGQYQSLGYPTRTVMLHIPTIIKKIESIIRYRSIDTIFSTPYEGAHPDHDICSYIGGKLASKFPEINHYEYSGYFLKAKAFHSGNFAKIKTKTFIIKLDKESKLYKENLMRLYHSQQVILKEFSLKDERFRVKPEYDFLKPPSRNIYYLQWQNLISPGDVVEAIRHYESV